jgi:cytochrome c-type biogenesis protein CcmH
MALAHAYNTPSRQSRSYNIVMNPALLFVLLIVAIAALVTWWLLRALKRDRLRETPQSTSSTNVEALRIERTELDRDLKLGLLTQRAHDEAMLELEARVLKEDELDRATQTQLQKNAPKAKRALWATASFATLVPIAAIGAYFLLGAPYAVIPEVVRPPQAAQESQMDELFRVAEERLKQTPDDAKGWYLLARARASVGQFDAAMKDYEKLVTLTPNDADAWADYADAAAGKVEGKMAGKPLELVNRALAIDPKQPKALLLRGTHEIQVNDLAAAEKTFTLAKSVTDPTTGFAQIADNALKDIAARRAGSTASSNTAAGASSTSKQGDAKTSVDSTGLAGAPPLAMLSIRLSEEAAKAASNAANAAIFVIVRAVDQDKGPPLAAKKLTIASLATGTPIPLTMNDSMIGGGGLREGSEVAIEARLSINGQPQAQPGDFRSAKQRIKLANDAKVALAIDDRISN